MLWLQDTFECVILNAIRTAEFLQVLALPRLNQSTIQGNFIKLAFAPPCGGA